VNIQVFWDVTCHFDSSTLSLRQEDVIFHWWVFMGQLFSEPERWLHCCT